MSERMYTYKELRFIVANQYKMSAQEIASIVNRDFHEGEDVRSNLDIQKIHNGRNILNKNQQY